MNGNGVNERLWEAWCWDWGWRWSWHGRLEGGWLDPLDDGQARGLAGSWKLYAKDDRRYAGVKTVLLGLICANAPPSCY